MVYGYHIDASWTKNSYCWKLTQNLDVEVMEKS